jgi:outer membrane protein, multidrug efflux system
LFKDRFSGGVVSKVELDQVESEYYSTLASVPGLTTAIAQQENALRILLGRNPGSIARGKTIDELRHPAVPTGIPSEILARRPDIIQAEQQLVAANARLGVAQAQFFPSITLTGANGTSSAELTDLFSGPAQTWNFSGAMLGPIFNAGKIRGQVKTARAQRQQAILAYQKAVQNSFQEVNDALVEQSQTRDQLKSLSLQVAALKSYDQLAGIRYDNGYTSYLEVLDAQRNLLSAQLSYTQTQQKLLNALITIYKTTGGGWIAAAEKNLVTPQVKDSKL